jgi:hypothetical protein
MHALPLGSCVDSWWRFSGDAVLQAEDIALVENVQRGMGTPAFAQVNPCAVILTLHTQLLDHAF